MRKTTVAVLLILAGTLASGQQVSPEQLFERGMDALSGAGPSRNDTEAFDLFHRSAELGYAPAQVVLGYFYDTGTLTPGSPSQAVEWYRKAAAQNDPLGQWLLGEHYFAANGVTRDLDAAQRWLQPAAEKNNPFAAFLLGRVMEERDYKKAPAYYKLAAEQGLPRAQFSYAKALKDGRGIAQNFFEAYVWFLVALDGGFSPAGDELTELEGGKLTAAEIASAKRKARELESSVTRAVAARGCTGWNGELDELPAAPPPQLQKFCR